MLMFLNPLLAQVGINKDGSLPDTNAILHVKGVNGDTFFIEDTTGNVGIGTAQPTDLLHVNGPIRINDGTEGDKKILASDNNGRASWQSASTINRGVTSATSPDGLAGIFPFTTVISDIQTFTVPEGRNFYILNIYHRFSSSLEINGMPIMTGLYNFNDGSQTTQQLNNPIIVGSGDILSGSSDDEITINGYFVSSGAAEAIDWACGDILLDNRDMREYETVLIGDQCWMAENMNIGSMIDDALSSTDNTIFEKYCYTNDNTNCDIYGGLYQWNEAMDYGSSGNQGICPSGWRIPSDSEWKTLEGTVDGTYGVGDPEWDGTSFRGDDAGLNLKSTSLWNSSGTGGTDLYGFTALPHGYRGYTSGGFALIGLYANFWSSTTGAGSEAYFRGVHYDQNAVRRDDNSQNYGYSVRCIKY